MNNVEVSVDGIDPPLPPERIENFCQKVLHILEYEGYELSLVLCDDDRIRELNRIFRGIDKETDVLSFPQYSKDSLSPGSEIRDKQQFIPAGDIVISIPGLYRNTQDFNVNRDEELKRLLIHGLLHLFGREHDELAPAGPMLDEQETIMKRLMEEKLF